MEAAGITKEQWEEQARRLEQLLGLYAGIGSAGAFGMGAIAATKTRYDDGERTPELFRDMGECE